MPKTRIAKLFKIGASQAVCLPAGFQFEGKTVYATRDETTGDMTLSDHPGTQAWHDFFEMMQNVPVPDDFMAERPMNTLPQDRHLFEDEES